MEMNPLFGAQLLCKASRSNTIETLVDRRYLSSLETDDVKTLVLILIRALSKNMEEIEESITPADFKAMTAQCNQEIKEAEQTTMELRGQQESGEEFRSQMEHIRSALRDAERQCLRDAISKDFVDTFIEKIYVTPEGSNTLRLEIKIFTGESSEKYLERIKQRTNSGGSAGHTFKKMIESYEQSMQ